MTEDTDAPAIPRGVRKVARGWEMDLDYPLVREGQEVATLKMRRPNVGDIETMTREADAEDAEAAGLEALDNMLARLLGITEEEMRLIDIDDWARMLEVITPLLEKHRRGTRI